MPRRTELTHAQAQEVKSLTFREATERFHIGYAKWRCIQRGEDWRPAPRARGRAAEGLEATLVYSVRERPHLNTQERAKELGCAVATAQRILNERGLSKLNARLEFAGYRVEAVRPLEVALQRRHLAPLLQQQQGPHRPRQPWPAPLAFYQLDRRQEGDHLDKLIALGLVKPSPQHTIRLMGCGDADKAGVPLDGHEAALDETGELPYALIIDRKGSDLALRQASALDLGDPPPSERVARMTLSK